MDKITIITLAIPGKAALKGLLMANSLRRFGGDLSHSPIWWLVPNTMDNFQENTRRSMEQLNIQVHPFQIEPEVLKFPFGVKTVAAAAAETTAIGRSDLLIWLDLDNIILHQPNEFILPGGKSLAYRPVHHRLIGPAWGEPLDSFWELVYASCQVPPGRQFKMVTHTGEEIQPYFNAGTFVTRPETGLLTSWMETFLDLYQQPEYKAWYQENALYTIFVHQAVFTGVILAKFKPQELQLLSPRINYPLHLHDQVPEEIRPSQLQDLTTLRYENSFEQSDWLEKLPILAPLRDWLMSQDIVRSQAGSTK